MRKRRNGSSKSTRDNGFLLTLVRGITSVEILCTEVVLVGSFVGLREGETHTHTQHTHTHKIGGLG